MFGFSGSADVRFVKSSCSWPEEEDDRERREEMETDSESESFNRGRLREALSMFDVDDLELLWRKCFSDLFVVVFCISFFAAFEF